MMIIPEFCGLYFFIRTFIKQTKQILNLSNSKSIILTISLSLLITILLKVKEFYSENNIYSNILHISFLSFIIQKY